ncbi:MAG: type II secretion system minor pseudopilin GspI [Pseudomonadales bacterium]
MTKTSRGFTLVEVLVALALLAIALPALLFNIAEQLSSLDYMREKSMAHWVAMNKMTELRLQNEHLDYLPRDKQNGSTMLAEREWFWTIETKKTVSDIVLRVDIKVRKTDDDKDQAFATVSNYFQLPVDTRQAPR